MGKSFRGGPTAQRAQAEFRSISIKDAERFAEVDAQLKKLARYLQPFFLEPPPEVDTASLSGWADLFRVGKRFFGISSEEIGQLISFLTGSLGEFLDHNYESEKMKTLFLANNVYGKHGGPYQPGTAIGLLFHLLSGGEHELQGFYGHVMGGMGAITQALAAAGQKLGVEIRTSAPVAQIDSRHGRARSVILEDGTEIRGRMVLSNADPEAHISENDSGGPTAGGFPVCHSRHQNGRTVRESKFCAGGGAAIHGNAGGARLHSNGLFILWFRRWHLPSVVTTSQNSGRFLKNCGWIALSHRTPTRRWLRRAGTS